MENKSVFNFTWAMATAFTHLSPMEIIDAAREVMGGIDIDPCTSETGQERIKARVYYTKETNGLKHRWMGRLYMCPNYYHIGSFVKKMFKEILRGDVTQAVVTAPTHETYKGWYRTLYRHSDAVCFVDGRIRWVSQPGLLFQKVFGVTHDQAIRMFVRQLPKYSVHGSSFFYIGPNIDKFIKEFTKIGTCYVNGGKRGK